MIDIFVFYSFEDQHFINEVEFSKLDYSSNGENNKSNIINESDEEERGTILTEFSNIEKYMLQYCILLEVISSFYWVTEFLKKKKFRNFVLLESSDDESELESKTDKLTSDNLVKESQLNVFTQELKSSWPEEFETRESGFQVYILLIYIYSKLIILFLLFRKIKLLMMTGKLINISYYNVTY